MLCAHGCGGESCGQECTGEQRHLCAKILTVARDAKEKNVPTIATVTTAAKNVLVLTALVIAMATIAAKNV